MLIRQADAADVKPIALVYTECFPRERDHELWIQSSYQAFPRSAYYVLEQQGNIIGYILWCVKNGFRQKAIVELEQLAIHPDFSGQGLGRKLIEQSVVLFEAHVNSLGCEIGSYIVTTSEGNFAEKLYKSTLGVSRAAMISDYGSGNELILYNRVTSD